MAVTDIHPRWLEPRRRTSSSRADWSVYPQAVVAGLTLRAAELPTVWSLPVPAWPHGFDCAGDPYASGACAERLLTLRKLSVAAGLEVDLAIVGDPHPITAGLDACAGIHCDVILLHTRHRRLMHGDPPDLVHRMHRATGLPVIRQASPSAAGGHCERRPPPGGRETCFGEPHALDRRLGGSSERHVRPAGAATRTRHDLRAPHPPPARRGRWRAARRAAVRPMKGQPVRADGYAPIGDYAIIGDGRTAALVARDGSIDWLCLPDLDSGSVFARLLDAGRGGAFRLAPAEAFASSRRYLPDSNVLETTFTTAGGSVRVTDAMLLTDGPLAPLREVVRQIEGLSGQVDLRWTVDPRFGYGERRTRIGVRAGIPVATSGADALAVLAFGVGEPECADGAITGRSVVRRGDRGVLALAFARGEPLIFSSRQDIERRLRRTVDFWRGWVAGRHYGGPWRDAVMRSALALKLLIHAPSGAIAAAATTSLPEELGGVRNWDYRYSWVRDSSATLDALERLGCPTESEAFFWWLLHASQLTHPRVRVLYRLNGQAKAAEREIPLPGYKRSAPVRVGNAAAPQLQLDVYGHLLQTAWLYADAGGRLDGRTAARIASMADLVSELWRQADSGIWEVRSAPQHFTESKMMCWIALDRACRLAAAGHIPGAGVARWKREAAEIRRFVSRSCWSESDSSYERFPGGGEVDAALLIPALLSYGGDEEIPRMRATVRRVRAELGAGPLLHRYRGADGLTGQEGAFLACSFWLVDALARLGQVDEATHLMAQLVGLGNDVGLYAEELDPSSGAFLGNFPQGLVHLALVNAAMTLDEAAGR